MSSSPAFDEFMELILELEGGYSDHPHDAGQKTMYGVTEAVARVHGYQGEMRSLPLETARAIYKQSYWDAVKGDQLPLKWALLVGDAAVNQGVLPAIKMLQRSLSTVQDGILGPVTLRLAAQNNDAWHRSRYLAIRAQRYQSTRAYDIFGVGWLTRLFQVGAKCAS